MVSTLTAALLINTPLIMSNSVMVRTNCTLRHVLYMNCMKGVPTRQSSSMVRHDRSGEVLRRPPRQWVAANRQVKRDRQINRNESRKIMLPNSCTAKSLSSLLGVRCVDVLKLMIKMGESPRTADEPVRPDLAVLIATELNFEPIEKQEFVDLVPRVLPNDVSAFPRRPPLVTVIGHIDHGKTTLLDVLRNSNIVEKEAGRITQHIGAFTVKMDRTSEESDTNTNTITFMDTPGHEAFTSLRERGVKTTDIALLVVAADNGVQEQTIEAIRVALAAQVQMVVCITKIDKVSDADGPADTRFLREQLFQHGVVVEGFRPGLSGVPCVEISAKSGRGMEELKEALILQAELMDLRAPKDGNGEGFVLESKMEKGRGALATVLVTAGTINDGDWVVIGTIAGRIKTLLNHEGKALQEATPGFPVEIIGLREVPPPGSHLFCVSTKEEAEKLVYYRKNKELSEIAKEEREATKQGELDLRRAAVTALTEETGRGYFNRAEIQDKMTQITKQQEADNDKPTISVLLKADVAGSLEGVQKALSVLPQDEIGLKIIKTAVGPIVEGDVALAKLTGSYLVAFNMKTAPAVQDLARKRAVRIIENQVVYSIVDSISSLMSALLPPDVVVDVIGEARVKEVFELNKGARSEAKVAGCIVTDGLLRRGAVAQIVRGENDVVHEGSLDTLRSFKQSVPEVKRGSDCGLGVSEFDDYQVGDVIRCIAKRFVTRKLGEKRKSK